ncbi:MAG: RES family NAD+ phosphorylase [Cyclobacteriaceae bacterium]|nr:RES family NAD+ phosphorylase [Cyclobacteriaceae bacterium]
MIVYRISLSKYTGELNSSGVANRWNSQFQYVIYCSENISLCALELLAHTSGIRPTGEFKILHIEIADAAKITAVDVSQLPMDWFQLPGYPITQKMGSEWYEAKLTLLMKVPSAIIQSEFNYIINTQHQDFIGQVKLVDAKDFFWDNRFPSSS